MKFNIDEYRGKYVMHCKTEEEAKDFCNYLNDVSKKWCNGELYKNENHWDTFREQTCYNFNEGVYDDIEYYSKHCSKHTILEWSDFMEKKEFAKAD